MFVMELSAFLDNTYSASKTVTGGTVAERLEPEVSQSINPILIRVYPRKRGWPDFPTLLPLGSTKITNMAGFKL